MPFLFTVGAINASPVAFRWMLEIGSSYTLNLTEVFYTRAYIIIIFTWEFVNTKSGPIVQAPSGLLNFLSLWPLFVSLKHRNLNEPPVLLAQILRKLRWHSGPSLPPLIRLQHSRPSHFNRSPGQTAYLLMPTVSALPFEAHPFTIVSIDTTNEIGAAELVFLINVRKGFTKRLLM
ncbi:hypothetical protein BKA93DRAFT_826973 [Sparassis latifolia]